MSMRVIAAAVLVMPAGVLLWGVPLETGHRIVLQKGHS